MIKIAQEKRYKGFFSEYADRIFFRIERHLLKRTDRKSL